jgi:hypothetical protein
MLEWKYIGGKIKETVFLIDSYITLIESLETKILVASLKIKIFAHFSSNLHPLY